MEELGALVIHIASLSAVALTVIGDDVVEHPVHGLKVIGGRLVVRLPHLPKDGRCFAVALELVLVVYKVPLHPLPVSDKVVEIPVLLIEVHKDLGSGILAGHLQVGLEGIVDPVLHERTCADRLSILIIDRLGNRPVEQGVVLVFIQSMVGGVEHIGVLGPVLIIGQRAQRGLINLQHLIEVLLVVDAVAAFAFVGNGLPLGRSIVTAAQWIGRAVAHAPFLA